MHMISYLSSIFLSEWSDARIFVSGKYICQFRFSIQCRQTAKDWLYILFVLSDSKKCQKLIRSRSARAIASCRFCFPIQCRQTDEDWQIIADSFAERLRQDPIARVLHVQDDVRRKRNWRTLMSNIERNWIMAVLCCTTLAHLGRHLPDCSSLCRFNCCCFVFKRSRLLARWRTSRAAWNRLEVWAPAIAT
jgi:hypothetical protein